jgi:hypothetical protein
MRVNMHVSDLFFNRDMQEAAVFDDRGNFASYNLDVLHREAETMLSSLEGLGVRDLPSVGDLVADFQERV